MFSNAELFAALRLVMSADDANAMLSVMSSAEGGDLTSDTLVLLSLCSDDLRRRVDEYRGAKLGSADAEREWQQRVAIIRANTKTPE